MYKQYIIITILIRFWLTFWG